MNLHDYARALRLRWWIIAAAVIVGIAAAYVVTANTAPTYSSRASMVIAVTGTSSPSDLQQANVFALQRAVTYANLATRSDVLNRAVLTLGDDTTASDLAGSVFVTVRPDTSIIDVDVIATDADVAADRANAVATALIREVAGLDTAVGAPFVELEVVHPAVPPLSKESPSLRTNLLIGLLVSLIAGIALVVVLNALDRKIRSVRDIPQPPMPQTLTALPRAVAARQEGFRALRTNLLFGTDLGRSLAITGVSSTVKTREVAEGLASALAEVGFTVLVVDTVVRAPVPANAGGDSEPQRGLADLIDSSAKRDSVVVAGSVDNVFELPAGAVNPQLFGGKLGPVLADLGEHYDYVIVIAPSVTADSAAAVIATLTDAVLLVASAGVSVSPDYRLAVARLRDVGIGTINVVLDGVVANDLRELPEPVQQTI